MAAADDGGYGGAATGLQEAIASCEERARRFLDLSPALRVVGEEIIKRTADAFGDGRSPFGETFPPLAPSTLQARSRALKSANTRTKSGGLTARAQRTRQSIVSSAKPLVDTGRARGSQHVDVQANTLTWSAVGYLLPHITGGARGGREGMPPKRNVSVFRPASGSGASGISTAPATTAGWELEPTMAKFMGETIATFIQRGKVR